MNWLPHVPAAASSLSVILGWDEETWVFVLLLAALIFVMLLLARRNRELHQRAIQQQKEHNEVVEAHLKGQRDHQKILEEKANRMIQILEEIRNHWR